MKNKKNTKNYNEFLDIFRKLDELRDEKIKNYLNGFKRNDYFYGTFEDFSNPYRVYLFIQWSENTARQIVFETDEKTPNMVYEFEFNPTNGKIIKTSLFHMCKFFPFPDRFKI